MKRILSELKSKWESRKSNTGEKDRLCETKDPDGRPLSETLYCDTDNTLIDRDGPHVKCNRCGKELDLFDVYQNFYIHKKVTYGSIYDGDILKIHLCNDCMDDLIIGCKIKPVTSTSE